MKAGSEARSSRDLPESPSLLSAEFDFSLQEIKTARKTKPKTLTLTELELKNGVISMALLSRVLGIECPGDCRHTDTRSGRHCAVLLHKIAFIIFHGTEDKAHKAVPHA